MDIKYKNFTLKPDGLGRFDLFEYKEGIYNRTVTKGRAICTKGDAYETNNNIAYSISLHTAIKMIIQLELQKDSRVVTLREYLDEFDKTVKSIDDKFNPLLNITIKGEKN